MKKIAEGFGIVAENAQRERIINETLDRLGGDQELIGMLGVYTPGQIIFYLVSEFYLGLADTWI